MTETIHGYWEDRAATQIGAATTNDVYLRKLEQETFIEALRRLPLSGEVTLLDVGCGDGATTLEIAAAFPDWTVKGVDFSANMIELANDRLENGDFGNVSFDVGDATKLADATGGQLFDVITTDRCLINIDDPEGQYAALQGIARQLKPGGHFIGIENFMDGQRAMNAARRDMGLKEIPVRWHNLFFEPDEFRLRADEWFDSVEFDDFASAYYFATRVVYSEMCQMRGEEPDYEHEIHQLATKLPQTGTFSPIRMIVARRRNDELPTREHAEKNREFEAQRTKSVADLGGSNEIRQKSLDWVTAVSRKNYCYNFSWLGRPIIQFPQDMLALQEIVWNIRPDVIVETGIAHGGSLIYSASLLEMLGTGGRVVGVDIDIREHNRREIERHPLYRRITMIEGSSIDEQIVAQVRNQVRPGEKCLVILDSNHTHEHVLRELELYSPLVAAGSYLIVFDTIVEDLPEDFFPDRPWGPGDNPKTAVHEFLKTNNRFEIDKDMDAKLQITVAPDGWLRCVKD